MQMLAQLPAPRCGFGTSATAFNVLHHRSGDVKYHSARLERLSLGLSGFQQRHSTLENQRQAVSCRAFDPSTVHAIDVVSSLLPSGASHQAMLDQIFGVTQYLSLAYERVTLPCSSMNCGDAIYRSTLDPVLRMEQRLFPDPKGLLLLGLGLLYLLAKPGVLSGAWDMYIASPVQRNRAKAFGKDDIRLGKKLAQGGFGTVYRGDWIDGDREVPVVVKKAKEFGVPEVWMNERIMRAAPNSFAEFLTAFEERGVKGGDLLWLIWRYEGAFTLFDLLQKRDWPYNAEALLRGSSQPSQNRSVRRKAAIFRTMMKSILRGLSACHANGVVHRDIKPENVMVSEKDRSIKLIDLGAAADLRIGTNYIPNEFLLDPRYAPPQQYIMSTQTPLAPPRPVAALLSPILWRMNSPDRFDMFSVGITYMQMVFRPLQSDNGLAAFNKRLAAANYSLPEWRRRQEAKGGRDWQEGFEVMDLENGAGWDFACQLVQYEPQERMTAEAALKHPAMTASQLSRGFQPLKALNGFVSKATTSLAEPFLGPESGTQRRAGGLTEAQINELLEESAEVPQSLRRASSTVSWWQGRQARMEQKLSQQKRLSGAVNSALGQTPVKGRR